ncbi:MAG: AMP-binding protein [Deltaproteobacteria bacterium]|nr:AMP-binding protein [Deltaproteobacteria bacterium]
MKKYSLFNNLLELLVKILLRLRYSIKIKGLDDIKSRRKSGILFLPNHPALIDPAIILSILHKDFAPQSLAVEFRLTNPLIAWISKRFGAKLIPDIHRTGRAASTVIKEVLSESIEHLRSNGNFLLYPAGRLKRSRMEKIRATSAVKLILEQIPDLRLVLVRQNGLWGSSFSWASGKNPDLLFSLKQGLKYLFLNGLFFMPRRPVQIEFVEPKNFPRTADRITMNRFLEDFYNADASRNTHVPYLFYEKGDVRICPEPEHVKINWKTNAVPETTQKLVIEFLRQITEQADIKKNHRLAYDLGLDSLAVAEVIAWLEKEFGFSQVDTDSLNTVGDVMLAAMGRGVSSDTVPLKPASQKWIREPSSNTQLTVAEGNTITEVFLNQARRNPSKLIIADQVSGEKTYSDLIAAIMVLKPMIKALPGGHVGIMLPASVGATTVYLATLFAGKIPVMINWTVGSRNMLHSLNLIGVNNVLTANVLVNRLSMQGINLEQLNDNFVFLEDLRKKNSYKSKISAWLKSRLSWSSLKHPKMTDTAVILFTSGSEGLPKAVPLSHSNIMTNIRDISSMATVREKDVLIGLLPPFHSFGITATIVLPLSMGIHTVYNPNPTEAATIARLIREYRASIVVSTPTFLNGIVKASSSRQLQTLRLVISGAEKCPAAVYESINEHRLNIKLLEGYGVTECSPIVSFNMENAPKPYTIGRVMSSLEHVIIDVDTGKEVGRNRAGMLLVRGPSVFSGYLNYDGESPFVEYKGKEWYKTGDLVSEDADGVLTFCGRLKRFVKLGGEMISLPAIEEVLVPHFAGDDDDGPIIAVEATPSEENPELILFTVKDTDRVAVNSCLRDAGLSALHNIRHVIKLNEIPVLGTGKTDYQELKKRLQTFR